MSESAEHRDGLAVVLGLGHQAEEALLQQRIQAAGGLVQDQRVEAVHEGGDNADLCLLPRITELADLLDLDLSERV
ncbi:hypothetical protein AB4305_01690 [Nocardia sp. 2YAB30]|uniref:hypothetical protein n=1 Tax=unclassified Nocardia TaxID=2637762 RepID=UPI003F9DB282